METIKNNVLQIIQFSDENMLIVFVILDLSTVTVGGRYSSVRIATRYELDAPGIESRWGCEIFRIRTDRPWGPPSLLYNWYRVFLGGKAAGAWC